MSFKCSKGCGKEYAKYNSNYIHERRCKFIMIDSMVDNEVDTNILVDSILDNEVDTDILVDSMVDNEVDTNILVDSILDNEVDTDILVDSMVDNGVDNIIDNDILSELKKITNQLDELKAIMLNVFNKNDNDNSVNIHRISEYLRNIIHS
jgi:hypothetical protein